MGLDETDSDDKMEDDGVYSSCMLIDAMYNTIE